MYIIHAVVDLVVTQRIGNMYYTLIYSTTSFRKLTYLFEYDEGEMVVVREQE